MTTVALTDAVAEHDSHHNRADVVHRSHRIVTGRGIRRSKYRRLACHVDVRWGLPVTAADPADLCPACFPGTARKAHP